MKLPSLLVKAALIGALITTGIATPVVGYAAQASVVPLSEAEAEALTFQREEEKLARDVYLTLYQKWGAVVFSNIAGSEQKHTDTMKKMLLKYNLPDPALPAIGAFNDPDLQEKYDLLVANGLKTYTDGLFVGATIEEIDLIDVQHAIDGTSRVDLRTAYQNLLEGSKNHLRAYVSSLAAQGIPYAPQFISQELYEAIIGL